MQDHTVKDLLFAARAIWGMDRLPLEKIVVRLQVGVGDLARIARDHVLVGVQGTMTLSTVQLAVRDEVRKELGNLIFSTIRWCDDLGFTPEECIDAAMAAQARYAASGRPR